MSVVKKSAIVSLSLGAALAAGVVTACATPGKDPALDGAKAPATNAPVATNLPPAASTPPTPATPSAIPTSGPSSSPTPTPVSSANDGLSLASGKSTSCTQDSDCRTFASYCSESPCACRVLAKAEQDPTCVSAGPKVSCVVNPCLQKVPRCQANTCVLTTRGPAGAATR